MKNILVLLLFTLITSVSFGQSNYQDVVYLKSGSIIRGVIIEQVPNKSIKIETAGRSVFVYQMDEIERIIKEPFQGRWNRATQSFGSGLQEGYKMIVELGYEMGTGIFGMDRLKLNSIYAYQLNPYFSLGLGTGLRNYRNSFNEERDFYAERALIPIFADFRANFTDNIFKVNNVSPCFSLGVGYSFDATNRFEGVGFLLNPIVGISFMVSEKSAFNVGIGYEMQSMNIFDYPFYDLNVNSGAISIDVGISF